MIRPRAGYPPPKRTGIEIVNGIGRHRFVEKTGMRSELCTTNMQFWPISKIKYVVAQRFCR